VEVLVELKEVVQHVVWVVVELVVIEHQVMVQVHYREQL
tara:strand:- start:569 stop:685 length:117 start_codon:yes stop_codon:yes gene_type:complete